VTVEGEDWKSKNSGRTRIIGFFMTPTEAITLYYDDMDILHIDNWRFFTSKKRDR
jgi:hypothetical protein